MSESLAASAPVRSGEKFRARMLHPLRARRFMLTKVPLALAAGLWVRELNAERCVVTVPYGWRTMNPFRSTYFAALSMAAEMSTGGVAMLAAETAAAPVAMLIVEMDAHFKKKVTGLTAFTCADGAKAFAAIAETLRTGEAATARLESVGRMPDSTEVAFTWTFKKRTKR